MTGQRSNQRIIRWGVPIGAVAATGAIAAGYALAGGPGAPVLPSRTTVQLLAAVNAAPAAPPMTATITETAALGLPSLPSVGSGRGSNPMSPLTWLSGTHTIKFWYTDPAHVRVAAPVPMGEADVRRDGRDVWTWNSQTQQATHLILPAAAAHLPSASQPGASQAGAGYDPTPQQAAQQLLKAAGPTTRVSLQQNVTVAGQPAYQISLAPKASGSLIGQIRIAVAAHRALPLRVQVFARGASSPAFQLGYTAIQFGTPAASNYRFTPPPGAKVKTVHAPAGRPSRMALHGGVPGSRVGQPPGAAHFSVGVSERIHAPQVVVIQGKNGSRTVVYQGKKGVRIVLPSKTARAQIKAGKVTGRPVRLKVLPRMVRLRAQGVPPGPVVGMAGPFPGATTIGHDWTAVLVLPAPGLPIGVPPGVVPNPGGPMQRGSASYGPGRQVIVPAGSLPAVLGQLMRAATPVHGSWGSGRLLTTSLVNVLVTNNRMLIGAVTPAVLYHDAAQLKNRALPQLYLPPKSARLHPVKPASTPPASPAPASPAPAK